MAKKDQRNFRLRVVLRPGAALGPGKIDLLEAIAETGSIRAAGGCFRMSYRRAWTLVAELNAMFDAPLVFAETGGRGGGGATLTPLGRDVVKRFRRMEAKTAAGIAPDLRKLVAKLKPLGASPPTSRRVSSRASERSRSSARSRRSAEE